MFKRALWMLFSLFVIAAVVPCGVNAGWVQHEIFWRKTGVGPTGTSTGIWTRDTIYAIINGADAPMDTTGSFTLDDSQPIPIAGAAMASGRSDSLVLGYIVFQQDTTSTTAASLVACTIAIDGKAGGYGSPANVAGWTVIDTVSVGIQAGGTAYAFPIRALTARLAPGPNAYGTLRARTTTGVGLLHSARAFIRYWKP